MAKYKILIADDEPNIVKIMEFELKKNGYDVITAADGEEALWIAERDKPDLIISDIMMPRMDGYEFCRKVKQTPDLRGIPFLFLTAKTGPENRIQGYLLGAAKYITKPCNRQELIKAIDMRLNLAEKARQLFAQKAKRFQGDLSVISVFSLLDMFFIGGWNGYIDMKTPEGNQGRIEVKDSIISSWSLDSDSSEGSLQSLLSWNQGSFVAEHE
jgi:DNA-binding response OmpR family regulator